MRTSSASAGSTAGSDGDDVTIPIFWEPRLNAYVVHFFIGNSRFSAVVDTGSPFLMIPESCSDQWGCLSAVSASSAPAAQLTKEEISFGNDNNHIATLLSDSGYDDTVEQFDYAEGRVQWKRAGVSFRSASSMDATATMPTTAAMSPLLFPGLFTLGVADESLLSGPGGIFFGLIKQTDRRIRPSFLSQTNVRSFVLDLTDKASASLTLSARGIGESDRDAIRLVKDLYAKYGDPVVHYTCKASSIRVNGRTLLDQRGNGSSSNGNSSGRARRKRPIYVILDTGVSGMVVSPDLLDEQYALARRNRDKRLWGDVEIDLDTCSDGTRSTRTLFAARPLTTPMMQQAPWSKDFGSLIIVGLAFLDGHRLSIDVDGRKAWID